MKDQDELFRSLFNRTCTRGTCSQPPVAWNYGAGDRDPQACVEHLTPEESEALRLAWERTQARLERLAQEPDCWSWPVPQLAQGLSEEAQAEALHLFQLGRGCAICSAPGDLVEDHDHETGFVRGNLCQSCNIREGKSNTTPPFVKYRERNPATILGVEVRYWSPFAGWAEPAAPPIPRDILRAAVDRLSRS